MKSSTKRMPNSRGLTMRVPEPILLNVRRVRSLMEIDQNKTITLNDVVIKALDEYTKVRLVNTGQEILSESAV